MIPVDGWENDGGDGWQLLPLLLGRRKKEKTK
jgi:hypothetical protein